MESRQGRGVVTEFCLPRRYRSTTIARSHLKPIKNPNPAAATRPEIVVDFAVDDGLLNVSLKNVGSSSAYGVKTSFDKPFHGLGGNKCITTMRLFREVAFMPPGKEFCQFVDLLVSYVKRKEPLRIKASVRYLDRDGNSYRETIAHDLRIYLELGRARLVKPDDGD
jgi:hypothetical protein